MNSKPQNSKQESILVVDDNTNNIHILMQILQDHHYKVQAATNGKTALMITQSNPPDLILLDVNMPYMSGFEVCAELKKESRTADIPVIFVTAADNLENKLRGFEIGGVDYITKPFQTKELLARVSNHLMIRSLQRQLQEGIDNRDALISDLEVFGHTVAHDIANPISGISMMMNLLTYQIKDRPISNTERIEQTITETQRLAAQTMQIIEELMLLSQVRKVDVRLAPFSMENVVSAVLQRLNHLITETKAEIIIPDKWPEVVGYKHWIEEVWANYISNALKYGGESPKIELGADNGSADSTTFWVRDNGGGIAKEDFAKLFQEFSRLDHHEQQQGTGLGLSIVKRIITRLGGRVYVESEKGKGSTFYFTLPSAIIESQ